MSTLLKTILLKLQQTTLNHKKKFAALVIIILSGYIAKKKLKLHHIISLVMFSMRFFSKVLSFLPMPSFSHYRTVLPFQYCETTFHPLLPKVMKVQQIIQKIKNKQAGSLEEMKVSVLSGVTLTLVLYNVESLYDLIKDKYISDFAQMGAEELFEGAISSLKQAFRDSLMLLKDMLSEKIHDQISKVDTSEVVSINEIDDIFKNMVESTFEETQNQNDKIHSRKSAFSDSIQFKRAENYFKSTKQYAKEEKKRFSPFRWIGNMISTIFPKPIDEVTNERYFMNQIFYTLTLKKHRDFTQWPNQQSHYLYDLVIEECYQMMISTNFCMVCHKNAELNRQIFMNRVRVYFTKRAKCEKKRILELLPIFYKIVMEELCNVETMKQLHERQLTNALRDVEFESKDSLENIKIRNRILNEISLFHEFQHINKDFQLKYFNERDGLEINPVKLTRAPVEEKDELEEMLEMFERNKSQGTRPMPQGNLPI